MKCAILVPPWRTEDVFLAAFARSMRSYQEPSGPLYVAAALQQASHTVVFMDGALYGRAEILDRVRRERPAFVGLSVCAPLWNPARALIHAIRRLLPESTIAVGGPWPAAAAERCLRECEDLDLCFTCEGEHAAVEVVEALSSGASPAGIPGLVYRGPDGDPVDTGYRAPIADLDTLPFPARELLGDDIRRCTLPPGGYRASPVAHLIGSRGCTNRCIYCYHLEREPVIRYRSAADILDEVEECVYRFGFREVRFLDDNFTGDRKRVLEICRGFHDRGLRVPWYISSRVDTVDPEMLRAMADAGCWAVLYGVETGTQANLERIGKNVTLDQVRQTVRWTREAGMEMFLPFMFGIPGETFEDGLRTIDFAIELDPYYANFNALTPFPGTWLWDHGHELGTLHRDPNRLTFQGYAFVPHTLTEAEMVRLRQIAFRRFYTRPRFWLRWLRRAGNRHALGAILRGVPSMFTLWTRRDAFRGPAPRPGAGGEPE